MRQPYFSIIMPAYNAAKSIEQTVNSILMQEYADFELIIVNDGSTDATEQVVQNLTHTDSRISLKTIPNGGPGNARNIGIQQATGQYLYLMDADDGLPEGALQTYATILEESSPDLIVSSYALNVMDKGEVAETREVIAENQLIESNEAFLEHLYPLMNQQLMYVIWNKVYRLDIIQQNQIQFPPYSSCEDRLFNIRYYQHVEKVRVVSDVLYRYSFEGRHSLTNKFLMNKFDTFVEFYIELKKLTLNHLDGSSALFLKGVMSCIIPVHSPECPFTFKQKLSYIKTILHHPEVIQATKLSSKEGLMRRAMSLLFQSKSKGLVYIASRLMYIVSNASPKVIEKLKGNF